MDISIIGGDKRNLYLHQLLQADGYNVGLCGFEDISPNCISLDEALTSEVIIGPIPFIKDGYLYAPFGEKIDPNALANLSCNHLLIGGGLSNISLNTPHIDLLEIESFLQNNAIPSAEGTIATAIQESEITLHNSNIVVVGSGRIGTLCASYFAGFGANVTIAVRNWQRIKTNPGPRRKYILYQNLDHALKTADIIINTPPNGVLTEEHIPHIPESSLIIDVSSAPYGVTPEVEQAVRTLRPHAMPGKLCPKTAAKYIRDEIIAILTNLPQIL